LSDKEKRTDESTECGFCAGWLGCAVRRADDRCCAMGLWVGSCADGCPFRLTVPPAGGPVPGGFAATSVTFVSPQEPFVPGMVP
jgi:hypothetical protein